MSARIYELDVVPGRGWGVRVIIEWLTTYPSGRSHTHSADDGQTGWKLHAVETGEYRRRRALCGCRPGTGWGVDLFIDKPCLRCVARATKLKVNIPAEILEEHRTLLKARVDFREWKAGEVVK